MAVDIASFYRFVDVGDPRGVCERVKRRCNELGLLGTILIAPEGVNGTLAGTAAGIRGLWSLLYTELGSDVPFSGRWTQAERPPFRRMRVKVKKEIVALGRPDVRPQAAARHLSPEAWNALLANPQTLVIDTRNRYEIEVGQFANALDPGTDSFREFVAFAEKLAADAAVEQTLERPVAMYCTGGIRCEKAAALLSELGFSDVSQLAGGVLNYLETVPPQDNRWQGECFVFDTRVAVDRDLEAGGYVQCHACRRPLSEAELESPAYREGVSCPQCIGSLEPERAARLEERRKQVQLARVRGGRHAGDSARSRRE